MPADYGSTARALALPTSPSLSPNPSRPSWTHRRSSSSIARRSQSPYAHRGRTLTRKLVKQAEQTWHTVYKVSERMTWWQRALAAVAAVVLGVGGILFLVYNEQIFGWLAPAAERWRDMRAGWLVVWLATFICAFPPMIGYSTSVTITGFVYGFPNGWFIVASATVVGSICSFLLSRTLFSGYVHRLVSHDKRFAALALTLKHDGLKLLIMIRFCPLPYSLSNGAMSTFPTVKTSAFALATAAATPKLLIHVFIGDRLGKIARDGGKMDAGTKAINYASIAGGAILGAVVAWLIYAKTITRARELEAEERAQLRESSSVDGAAGIYSDDMDAEAAATIMNEDDISLHESSLGARYHDDYSPEDGEDDDDDDEDVDDVFRLGDGDEEETIGMPSPKYKESH